MLQPVLEEKAGVFTVSELNARIKVLLESNFRFLWVKGEISNFRAPASGHYYFTLKDEHSQIRGVFFRQQNRLLRFAVEDGLQVICQGRLSVYEPRGEYQIIVEVMEPQGIGALQLAFEQLKMKLEAEGLFDSALKKKLPLCPVNIAVITSPTGAAIRDILKVLQRAPYPLSVTLLPVRVQGQEAAFDIASAIAAANETADRFGWDLLVVGRGGGSIEDLWPFNEEIVARALASSVIPTISAVGHEIDLTISDLVADYRAPTPTAAAQLIVSQLEQFQRDLELYKDRASQFISRKLEGRRQKFDFLRKRLVDPKRRLADLRLMVTDRLERLQMAFDRRLETLGTAHAHLYDRLRFVQPLKLIDRYRSIVDQECGKLALQYRKVLDSDRLLLQESVSKLESLSPLAVLSRGYSITYLKPDMRVVRKASDVRPGSEVRIRLSEGQIECRVEGSGDQAGSS
jgi:exodeoxyribonuclease VII large subunit